MIYKGQLISQASGKLNGKVFAHNRGGAYIRDLGVYTDPNTTEQGFVRAAMTECKTTWDGLTAAQRLAWEAFSRENPRANRIGAVRPIGGFQELCRMNVPRRQAAGKLGVTLAMVTVPPSRNYTPLAIFTAFGVVNPTLGTCRIVGLSGTEWRTENGAGLLVYVGLVRPTTVNRYFYPYTLFACGLGAASPTTITVTLTGQTPLVAARRYFWRLRVTRADGRLGEPQIGFIAT